MSSRNMDTVRQIYARWSAGEEIQDLIANDVEWVNPPDAIEPGTRTGREGFNTAVDNFNAVYPKSTYDLSRVEEIAEDEVLAVMTIRALGAGSQVAAEMQQGHIWTLRDGKGIRFRWFRDPAHALEAAGLES